MGSIYVHFVAGYECSCNFSLFISSFISWQFLVVVLYVCIASARTGVCNIFVRLTCTTLAGGFPEHGAEGDARS